MAVKQDKAEEKENLIAANVVSGITLEKETIRLKSSISKVIRNTQAAASKKVQIIGGDSDDNNQDSPPAIVIEKENDQISKIIVKCPCGRHAELICHYEENT